MDIFETIENALQESITAMFTTLGKTVNVIISHENGVEPTGSYVVINVLDMTQQGQAGKSSLLLYEQNQGKETFVKTYEALVQLNFLGSESSELSALFHNNWRANTPCREHFLRNNLAPRTISNLRRAPQLRESVWIKSFACDVRVGFVLRTIQDVDWADRITVNGVEIPLNN